MRNTLRTVLVSLTAATALLTMTGGPAVTANAAVASFPRCGGDDCTHPETSGVDLIYLTGLVNKLNAILDEFPSAGVARPVVPA